MVLNSLKPPFIVICYYAYLHFFITGHFSMCFTRLLAVIIIAVVVVVAATPTRNGNFYSTNSNSRAEWSGEEVVCMSVNSHRMCF